MPDLTHLLDAAATGDPQASADLLPLVYDELRKLAAARMAAESPGQTLQATALVHEAYLRLVGSARGGNWKGLGHFFAAAAEAMRRILVDRAREKGRLKRGEDRIRFTLDDVEPAVLQTPEDLLAVDDALDKLAAEDPEAAELVNLRCFAGLSVEQAAESIGLSRSTAYEHWAYARAWLFQNIHGIDGTP